MLFNLSELLSGNDKTKVFKAEIEMNTFHSTLGNYGIFEKNPIEFTITKLGKKKLSISGDVDITLNIPCNRCLEDVKTKIKFTINKEVNLSESESDEIEEQEEQDYIDGYNLDVDKLVYGEVLIHIPSKTLCSENCKGLCPKCGTNLNESECGCDRESLDPRMSVIKDIFNNFKEV